MPTRNCKALFDHGRFQEPGSIFWDHDLDERLSGDEKAPACAWLLWGRRFFGRLSKSVDATRHRFGTQRRGLQETGEDHAIHAFDLQ
ncbi:hypothetical protein [Mesorhizobium sp.]|uniref:hypothetical protein n=1 Tax=Mesorhizobium sp. TaxID=1871066 RepID=UPI0025BA864A|nr:hypothetical protein [Mesorhizobium sp.]